MTEQKFTIIPKRRGRPRKDGQNSAPPAVPKPAATPRRLDDARLQIDREAAEAALDAWSMLRETVAMARAGLAKGQPISRNELEAGKTVLSIAGIGSSAGVETAKDLAAMSASELEAFIRLGEEALKKRGNAAKDVTPSTEVSDLIG
jgi:hypothetical protein